MSTNSEPQQEFGRSLIFFLPTLELTSTLDIYGVTGVSPDTHQDALSPPADEPEAQDDEALAWRILRDPKRRLAWHLLSDGDEPFGWRNLAAAAFSPANRLRRARRLLYAAEDQERRGNRAAKGTWTWVHREWGWVAGASATKDMLLEHARCFALEEPDALVKDVLLAVEDELLKVFPLKWYLLGDERARKRHRGYLTDRWTLTCVHDDVKKLYTWFLDEWAREDEPPSDHVVENVTTLLDDGEETALRPDILMEAFLRVLQAWFEEWAKKKRSYEEISTQFSRLSRLEKTGPPYAAVFQILSLLRIIEAGKQLEQKNYGGAVRELGRALAYDPFNQTAHESYESLVDQGRQLEKKLSGLSGEAYTAARRIVEVIGQSHRSVSYFEKTPQGSRILKRRLDSARFEIIRRLRLDPDSEATAEALDGLAECLEVAATVPQASDQEVVDAETFARKVRALVEERGGALHELDWEMLENAWLQAPAESLDVLARVLPEPEPSSHRDEIDLFCKVSVRSHDTSTDEEVARKPRIAASWSLDFGTWLFSSRDPAVKLCAAAGLILLLHGSILSMINATNRYVTNRAYEDVLEAVKEGHDEKTISRGVDFLVRRESNDDQRANQVLELLEEALLLRVIDLTEKGAENEALNLMKEVQSAIP